MIILTCNEKPIIFHKKKPQNRSCKRLRNSGPLTVVTSQWTTSHLKTVSRNNASKITVDFSVTFENFSQQNSLPAISTPRHQRDQFKAGHQQIFAITTLPEYLQLRTFRKSVGLSRFGENW